jgi:hypothetical protein
LVETFKVKRGGTAWMAGTSPAKTMRERFPTGRAHWDLVLPPRPALPGKPKVWIASLCSQ